jgi:hypothetical protein
MTFVTKNSYFDLTVVLTEEQLNFTRDHPDGYYYLQDITDAIKLGNNTIVQNDDANIYGPTDTTHKYKMTGNTLHFENRFIPSTGIKNLRLRQDYPGNTQPRYLAGYDFYFNSGVLKGHFKQNSLDNIHEKNSYFDFTYVLTEFEYQNTFGNFPTGAFYLRNETDEVNLGNNTIVADDYSNMNIFGPNNQDPIVRYRIEGNTLNFVNRFFPSTGVKNIRVWFYNGNYVLPVSPVFSYHSFVMPPENVGYIFSGRNRHRS